MCARMVRVGIVSILPLLCTVAAADIAPMLPAVPVTPPAGPTEMDRVYYYSTIGQEMAYAKLASEATGRASACPAESKQPGTPTPGSKVQAPTRGCVGLCRQCPAACPRWSVGLGCGESGTAMCGLSRASQPEPLKSGIARGPMRIAQWNRFAVAICPILFALGL